MASIRSLGVGSGLDLDNIVQQLVAAERQPVEQRLNRSEIRVQSQLSALGTVSGALSALQNQIDTVLNPGTLAARTATSQEPEVFTASAGPDAAPGAFSVEVVSLASVNRVGTGAFDSAEAEIGTGTLELALGDAAFSVEIEPGSNSLADIRDAINSASGNSGIEAAILNDDAGSRLILSGTESGAANTISVTASGGDGGLSSLEALTQLQAAEDAVIRFDSFEVSRPDNRIEGVIDGVTIDLLEARPGETFTLTVAEDRGRIVEQVGRLVDRVNALNDTLDRVTAFNAETGQGAPLIGDSTIRLIESRVSAILSRQVGSPGDAFGSLPALGIRTNEAGALEVDENRLNEALDESPGVLQEVLTGDRGIATALGSFIDGTLGSNGLVTGREDGLRSRLDGINEQRQALDDRMNRVEARFVSQFAALDGLVASLQQTGNFLQQQLANLPGPVRFDR